MLLTKRRGELIERKTVMLQVAYRLTSFRARVPEPSSLARRLVDGGFEEKRRCEVQEMVKNDFCAMLKVLPVCPGELPIPIGF
jgi:hypothetical protein